MKRKGTETVGVYRLDDVAGFLLRKAYQRASGNLMRRIGEHDLTPMQFSVLVRLRERGQVSQNELGRLAAMDPPTAHGVVRRLKARALIAANPDPADKRLVLLSLTAKGAELVESLIPVSIGSNEETLSPLTEGEQRLLIDLLRRIS
jgi:DNA-binding MarR family transcriptional regulator